MFAGSKAMSFLIHGEPLYQLPPMAVVYAQGPILLRCTKCATTLSIPVNTPQVSCGVCKTLLTVPASAAPQPTTHLTPVFTPQQVQHAPPYLYDSGRNGRHPGFWWQGAAAISSAEICFKCHRPGPYIVLQQHVTATRDAHQSIQVRKHLVPILRRSFCLPP